MGTEADDGYRLRLEGRAELLDAARLRYRALLTMVRALRWRARLKKNAVLLRETAAAQDAVDEALASATRRAKAERWPPRAPMARCLVEVAKLRAALSKVAARRLGDAEPSLGAALARLETEALAGPREVRPGRRWATALEILPATLPELRRCASFGAKLEQLFGRPAGEGDKLPFTAREAQALSPGWDEGEAALVSAWERLAALDRSGSLVGYLRRRARRAPVRAPENGPGQLLHAEFWHAVARARLRELADARFGPVEAADGELLDLAAFACRREEDEGARLPASARVSEERAALFELAHELWCGLKGSRGAKARGADGSSWPAGTWERLLERAHRADGSRATPGADAERLRETLRLFIRIRARGEERRLVELAGPYARSFASLVQQARTVAEVPPLRRGE